MRLILTLAVLTLSGCDLGGRVAKGEDKAPAAQKDSETTAILRAVKDLSETVGNTNGDLSAVEQRLGNVETKLGNIEKLLSADTESSSGVPQIEVPEPPAEICVPEPPAIKADAAPIENASQRITFQGKPIDVAAWLKRSVTFVDIRGDVDAHLRDHGLDGDFSRFSRAQKLQLHSVAHSYGVPLKSTPARKIVVKAPAVVLPYSSNCPNGNCARQGMYGYSNRSRLFGWRR